MEPRTAEQRLQQMAEDHERRLRALEAQDRRADTDVGGYVPLGGARCIDLLPALGDIGLCNGQFECGPTTGYPIAECWTHTITAGANCTREAGGVAGNWCLHLSDTTGVGCLVSHCRMFPVYENRTYYEACHVKGDPAGTVFQMGMAAYNAAGAALGTVWAYNAAPGAAWVAVQRRVGPGGDVAWPAGTRYAQVVLYIKGAGIAAYVDDVQFQQTKSAYSPGIHLVSDYVADATDRTNNTVAYVQHVGSPMTLTFEEPGYLWYGYSWTWFTSVARGIAAYSHVFIDGAMLVPFQILGAAANEYHSNSIFMRSPAILARGAHTVDFRWRAAVAGDVVTIADLEGSCFYVRAY